MNEQMKQTLGILGLGAFGRLMVQHLAPYFDLKAYDPSAEAAAYASSHGVAFVSCAEVAACDVVVIATPVPRMEEAAQAIAPHLKAGALVMDVGSVKMKPAEILLRTLPSYVDIVCLHPLFGPQSAKNGIQGLKIVVCPIRGQREQGVIAFLDQALGLVVSLTTPEEHDREAAIVQGLTHLIAKVLVEMEPLPKKLTTRSFELLMEGVEMVRHDSMELFLAIERDNPFSAELRRSFFSKADALRQFLESHDEKQL